mgnify:CR=1 FL=1
MYKVNGVFYKTGSVYSAVELLGSLEIISSNNNAYDNDKTNVQYIIFTRYVFCILFFCFVVVVFFISLGVYTITLFSTDNSLNNHKCLFYLKMYP